MTLFIPEKGVFMQFLQRVFKDKTILPLFIFCHTILWIALFMAKGYVPMDTAEAFVWGREMTLGTNKHPFLSGWIAHAFLTFFNSPFWASAFLSQISIIIAFIYNYKLARCFLPKRKALLSVLMLEGIIYYTVCALEFNVNVLSLPLLSSFFYYFYQATEKNKLIDWIFVGVLSSLLMITKYTNVFFLMVAFIYICCAKKLKDVCVNWKVLLAGCCACVLVLPHLMYLPVVFQTMQDYYASRTIHPSSFMHACLQHLRFLGAQFLASFMVFVFFGYLLFKLKIKKIDFKQVPLFIRVMFLFPFVLYIAVGFAKNMILQSMWAYPSLTLLPIFLMLCLPEIKEHLFKKMVGFIFAFMFLQVFVLSLTGSIHISKKANFPAEKFGQDIQAYWNAKVNTPLEFVGGDIWLTANAYLFTKDKPRVLTHLDPKQAPWIDMHQVQKKGMFILAQSYEEFQQYKNDFFKTLPDPFEIDIILENKWGKRKKLTYFGGIIPPEQE